MRFKKTLLWAFLILVLSTPAQAVEEGVLGTLKNIEDKQDQILARLDDIQRELDIVKVRASN
jgi:hypothetical protein